MIFNLDEYEKYVNDNLTFKDFGHVYTWKNSLKRPISATTLMGIISPFDASAIDVSVLKRAQDYGTLIHLCIETHYKNNFNIDATLSFITNDLKQNHRFISLSTLWLKEITREGSYWTYIKGQKRFDLENSTCGDIDECLIESFIQALMKFIKVFPNNWKFVKSEMRVYSEKYNVAGSIDAVIKHNDKHYLLDFKVQADMSFSYLKTAIQTEIYKKIMAEYGVKIENTYALLFRKTKGLFNGSSLMCDFGLLKGNQDEIVVQRTTEWLFKTLEYGSFKQVMNNKKVLKTNRKIFKDYHDNNKNFFIKYLTI